MNGCCQTYPSAERMDPRDAAHLAAWCVREYPDDAAEVEAEILDYWDAMSYEDRDRLMSMGWPAVLREIREVSP